MRLLITGVSGFVGCRLTRHLLESGFEVEGTFVGRRPESLDIGLHRVDVRDAAEVARVMEAIQPDRVLHLAGLSHVGRSFENMSEYFQVNVIGTENVLRAAADRPVVLVSSAEVYGRVPTAEQPIAESRPVDPRSPYAMTKAAAERLVLAHDATIVRAFNLVGPGQSTAFALPTFAEQLAKIRLGRQRPVLSVGNLEARRDFLHVDDAAAAFALMAEKAEPGAIYNLGSGIDYSIREVLDMLIERSGVEARVELDPERLRPVDVPLLRADNQKLVALGWRAKRTLEDAVNDLWEATLRCESAAGS